ncbi:MAG: ATP cone domain-containing protein, partial [Candidatus Omnitrophota bacterium]
MYSTEIKFVRKRDGRLEPFDPVKIESAIFSAAKAVGGEDERRSRDITRQTISFLEVLYKGNRVPTVENVQDLVEKILIEDGHAKTAKAYILYREKRRKIRDSLKVRKRVKSRANSTDLALLVTPLAKDEILNWDKGRIALALQKETRIAEDVALEVASSVEKKVFNSGMTQISTSLIREL